MKGSTRIVLSPTRTLQGMKRLKNAKLNLLMIAPRADDECRTVFDTQCSTSQKEHEVEDNVVNCETEYEEKCEVITIGRLRISNLDPCNACKYCFTISLNLLSGEKIIRT